MSHIVWKYSLRTKKRFSPISDAPKVPLRDFQDKYRKLQGKISVSRGLIRDYGLCSRIYLGRPHLFYAENIATYLYDNTIHPRFFAEALHVIASNALALGPVLERVQLRNLRRDNVAAALGPEAENVIGKHFELFSKKTDRTVKIKRSDQEKLDILQRLGVLVLEPGCSLPIVSRSKSPIRGPSKPAKYRYPRPPIENVDPEEIISKKKQLNLPGFKKPGAKG